MTFTLILLTVMSILSIYAAVSDLLTMTIPNRQSSLRVAALIAVAVMGGPIRSRHGLSFASGSSCWPSPSGSLRMGSVGGGDAELAAVVALWFGLGNVVEYLLLAAIAGGALTLARLTLRSVSLPAFALSSTWLDRLHDGRSGVLYASR